MSLQTLYGSSSIWAQLIPHLKHPCQLAIHTDIHCHDACTICLSPATSGCLLTIRWTCPILLVTPASGMNRNDITPTTHTATAAAATAITTGVTPPVLCAIGRDILCNAGANAAAVAAARAAGSGSVCLTVAAYPVQVADCNCAALDLAAHTTARLLPEGAVFYIQSSTACNTAFSQSPGYLILSLISALMDGSMNEID